MYIPDSSDSDTELMIYSLTWLIINPVNINYKVNDCRYCGDGVCRHGG